MRDNPWRHKYGATKEDHIKVLKEKGLEVPENINAPLFSVHKDKNGNYRKYTYVESRWFYSVQYEKFAKKEKVYKKLLKLLRKGININIVGYDARSIKDGDDLSEKLLKMYKNPKYPFGHELVLASLLFKDLELIEETPWDILGKPKSKEIIEVQK